MLVHVALFSLCWFGLSTASAGTPEGKSPRVVLRLSASGLASFSELASKYFMADYLSASILGVIDTNQCLFDVCFLQNITVHNFVPPESYVTIKRGDGIEWNLMGTSLDLIFDYELLAANASVKGSARVSLSGISIAAKLKLGRGINDSLVVSVTQCSVDIEKLYSDLIDATWEGHSDDYQSVFYRDVYSYFENRLRKSVAVAICSMGQFVTDVIPNNLRWMGNQLRFVGLTVDSRLVRDPIVGADYIEAAVSGEVRLLHDEEGASFQPSELDLPSSESSMAAVYVSDYVINTLADAIFKINRFAVNFTKHNLPGNYPNLLDTSCDEYVCLGSVFPRLAAKHPNVSATLVIQATNRPSLNIFWLSARLTANFDFKIVIPGVNDSEASVAKLSLSFSMQGIAFASGDRAQGRVYSPKVLITDKGSPEEFATHLPRFNYVLQMIADLIAIPLLNYAGADGIPLQNLYGLRLVRPDLRLITNAFAFNTDIFYDTLSL